MYTKGYEKNSLISEEYAISLRSLNVFRRLDSEIKEDVVLEERKKTDRKTLELMDKEKGKGQ